MHPAGGLFPLQGLWEAIHLARAVAYHFPQRIASDFLIFYSFCENGVQFFSFWALFVLPNIFFLVIPFHHIIIDA